MAADPALVVVANVAAVQAAAVQAAEQAADAAAAAAQAACLLAQPWQAAVQLFGPEHAVAQLEVEQRTEVV